MGDVDPRPAVIVRVADEADVATVIAAARQTGLELAIRSGGHSGAGHSTTDGGIVLDLRDLKALDIDVASRTAWAETGLTAAEVSTRRSPSTAWRSASATPARSGIGGHHPRRRRRLPRPQARPDDRLPARRGGRDRGRPAAARRRRDAPGPVLGDPRRRRQLRRGDPLPVPARTSSPAFVGGMLILPATPETVARLHRRGRGRAGGALDDRQRHAGPADAVPAARRCTASW